MRIVAGILFSLTIGFGYCGIHCLNIKNQMDDLEQDYLRSAALTKLALVEAVNQITSNRAILEQLQSGSMHALRNTLISSQQQGSLDHIEVVDKNCNIVAPTRNDGITTTSCPNDFLGNRSQGRMLWSIVDGTPVLKFMRPFENTKDAPLFAFGMVHFNQSWVQSHAALFESMQGLGVRIGSSAQNGFFATPILRDGELLQNQSALYLISSRADVVLIKRLGHAAAQGAFAIALALLLGIAVLFVKVGAQSTAVYAGNGGGSLKSQQAFLSCLDVFFANMRKKLGPHALETLSINPLESLQEAQRNLTALEQSMDEKAHRDSEDSQALNQQLEALRIDLSDKAGALRRIRPLESIRQQLIALQKLRTHKQEEDSASDLEEVLLHGSKPRAQSIANIARDLHQKLQTQGARKFFRALSETTDVHGRLLFEVQLNTIYESAQGILQQSAYLANELKQLNQKHALDELYLDHFSQSATLSQIPTKSKAKLPELALFAQTLASSLRTDTKTLSFVNLFELGAEYQFSGSEPLWRAVLFHIYAALVLRVRAQTQQVEIITQPRALQSQATSNSFPELGLVISVPSLRIERNIKTRQGASHADAEQEKHLELAELLAERYHLKIDQVRGPNGVEAVRIRAQICKLIHRGELQTFTDGSSTTEGRTQEIQV